MKDLEKYYGIRLRKRISAGKMLSRSARYKTRQDADRILREVNALFVGGFYDQCFAYLEKVVCLVPEDPRPFYLLGLIHEEQKNFEKAGTSYLICALLKKGDTSLWKKVLDISAATNDDKNQAIALGKIYRREPSKELLLRQLDCLKRLNKKYWIICCEIELFEYCGVDETIFDRFKHTHHRITMHRICKRLVSYLYKHPESCTEYYVRNTVLSLYKIKSWSEIAHILDTYYFNKFENAAPEILIINYIARMELLKGGPRPARVNDAEDQENTDIERDEIGSDDQILNSFALDGLSELGLDLGTEGLSLSNLDGGGANRENSLCTNQDLEDISATKSDGTEDAAEVPIAKIPLDFINIPSFWESLKDTKYVDDLANYLQRHGEHDTAIRILEQLSAIAFSAATKIRIGDFYCDTGNYRMAIENYRTALDEDPTSMEVRSKLHQAYMAIGESGMVAEYQSSVQALEFSKTPELLEKKSLRYSSDKCKLIRTAYNKANEILVTDYEQYPQYTRALLHDFFTNAFVISPHKNFRNYCNKHEKVTRDQAILPYNEEIPKRKLAQKLIRISALHGLDVDEWFYTIKQTSICFLQQKNYEAARKLLKNALSVYLLRDAKYLVPLSMLALKSALHLNDFKMIVGTTKRMVLNVSYSATFFLYFLCSFAPNFYRYRCFNNFQKCIQRIFRRTAPNNCLQAVTSTRGQDQCGRHASKLSMPATVPHTFLLTASYLPRYLFTETVDDLNQLVVSDCEEINTLLAIINMSHSKCRVLTDRMKYAKIGMQLLAGISDESLYKKYNLAKAYHFFGYLTHAERLYLEVIAGDNMELKQMSVFNLSLIFMKNKSREVLVRLLEKASGYE